MNKFNKLFTSGLILISFPLLLVLVMVISYFMKPGNRTTQKEIVEKKTIYDTVKVKVTDTVIVEKIKYVKKEESTVRDTTQN